MRATDTHCGGLPSSQRFCFVTDALEADLRERLADQRVSALGEIGLDYHYDFSPREDQRLAFRRQLRLAKECGLPVILHVREAHDDALAIMREEGLSRGGSAAALLQPGLGDA